MARVPLYALALLAGFDLLLLDGRYTVAVTRLTSTILRQYGF